MSVNWNKYIGIPYVEHGRTTAGVDCWGLVCLAYKYELGIVLPSYDADYATTQDRSVLELVALECERWQRVDDLRELDVISLNINGLPWHVGVVASEKFMVHARRGDSVVLEAFATPKWKQRINGIYRYAQ